MDSKVKAHIAIFSANLIYGVNYVIAKGIMPDYVDAFGLTVMRVLGALLLFWIVSSIIGTEKIEKKDFTRLILGGIFGVAINQMLFLKGLSYSTPISSAIIMTINPLMVLIIAAIILKEPITSIKIAGILIGGGGAIFLILSSGNISLQSAEFKGNLMMFGNATSYALYLVIIKPLMSKYKPVTVIKWVFLFGSLLVVPMGISELKDVQWQTLPTNIILSIGFVVIGTTFFAYLLNIIGLKSLKPSTVSVYIYSQPVIATIVSVILNRDTITITGVVSTILVFTGVYLVSVPVENYKKRFPLFFK